MVLKVQNDRLILDQRRQGFHVVHAMISQLAWLHSCFIEKKDGAIDKSAHEALLHLVGVIIFARSEPDLAQ